MSFSTVMISGQQFESSTIFTNLDKGYYGFVDYQYNSVCVFVLSPLLERNWPLQKAVREYLIERLEHFFIKNPWLIGGCFQVFCGPAVPGHDSSRFPPETVTLALPPARQWHEAMRALEKQPHPDCQVCQYYNPDKQNYRVYPNQ